VVEDGTNIQGFKHDRTKDEKGIRFTFLRSTRHSNDGNRRNGIKKAINTQQAKGSIHILLDRWGLRRKEEEERNPHSSDQLVKIGRKEGRSRDPNHLAVLNDLGVESAQDCPYGP
jgi:hypothetical protein